MATATRLITAGRFSKMQFEFPVELVRGKVVEMPPPEIPHGIVCGNVGVPLSLWSRTRRTGLVAFNDAGIVTRRRPDTVRGPDVMFIPQNRLTEGRAPSGLTDIVPSLVIEVRSPSDRWKDIYEKIVEYFERGVAEVWVVDYRKRVVHVYRTDDDPIMLTENDTITSEVTLPGFSCEVREFFVGV